VCYMIRAESLRIDYDDVNAVYDLNLHVSPGEIFGLVGPNGAGKTSTIKALAGILDPTYGDIKISGFDLELDRQNALRKVGYMPDFFAVYEHLKVWEYLDVFAAAYHIPASLRLKKIKYWVDMVNLGSKYETLVRELSRGMRQRLVLAKTLIPDPDVLLLDEPASGLDPIARKEMRDVLKDAAAAKKAVVISSHIQSELSDFCNAVGIMQQGKLLVAGAIEDIRRRMQSPGRLVIHVPAEQAETINRVKDILGDHPALTNFQQPRPDEIHVDFSGTPSDAAGILARLVEQAIPVCGFRYHEDSVEDIFFKCGLKEVS